jgi:hemoglobin
MKTDISNKKDIELLVNSFYEKVKTDAILHPFFANLNFSKHLPVMYRFFENMVFYTGSYTGNPMQKHKAMNRKKPITARDFKQWVKLFNLSVDENFIGEKANLIKQRVHSIATVLQIKMNT